MVALPRPGDVCGDVREGGKQALGHMWPGHFRQAARGPHSNVWPHVVDVWPHVVNVWPHVVMAGHVRPSACSEPDLASVRGHT